VRGRASPGATDEKAPELRNSELVAFLERTAARVKHGRDMAFYSSVADNIQIPTPTAFVSEENYWSTMLHELTHWTGHASRLDRDLTNRFGTMGYAAEELVAELGSAYLCAELGVHRDLRHPELPRELAQGFRDDTRAFFRASSLAQRAADFVLGFRDPVDSGLAEDSTEDAP
jgi:antirestriction protein ArdC